MNNQPPAEFHPQAGPSDLTEWTPHPVAGQWVGSLLRQFVERHRWLEEFETRLLMETGVRLIDLVDTIGIPRNSQQATEMFQAGFSLKAKHSGQDAYTYDAGFFPALILFPERRFRLKLKVESVAEFLLANQLQAEIEGTPFSAIRKSKISTHDDSEIWIVERHGIPGWKQTAEVAVDVSDIARVHENLLLRQRHYDQDIDGYRQAESLIDLSIESIGVNRTCDLFFQCERKYWESRNDAAHVQADAQRKMGFGWANQDHHTYRSSRSMFARLIGILEKLGFHCRERFYAGKEAGWGAQVLEQPDCGIVIFADVDLTEEELTGDFAHEGLEPSQEIGTIGLWCALHGEAFLQAGLHHLECQYDFEAARNLLIKKGIGVMDPFTDFKHLRQCFTQPPLWKVCSQRIERLFQNNQITKEQATQFQQQGAVGSHLEILERNDGYKGFNQTGVSQIIAQTDPRNA